MPLAAATAFAALAAVPVCLGIARSAGAFHRTASTDSVRLNVVVTGSSTGLGKALAMEHHRLGDNVVIVGRDAKRVDKAVFDAKVRGGRADSRVVGHVCDVRDAKAVDALAAFAQLEFGNIDCWVNNAGCSAARGEIDAADAEDVDRVIQTNLTGTIYGAAAAMRAMKLTGGGAIFLMEGAGSRGESTSRSAAYGASKAALPQLAKSLAAQGKPHGIAVGLLSPGMVTTELLLGKNLAVRPSDVATFEALAERPQTVAAWLVPRVRAAAASRDAARPIRYLTLPSVLYRVATQPLRAAGRLFDASGALKAPGAAGAAGALAAKAAAPTTELAALVQARRRGH
ncbi:hypothetical protein M885DRAFT_519361 [Pelagophyceae sp. CCMP2097]|nr:hypothetical protein M885DRAFT_519361 [Pelagophyceae sp. CCMP2097]